MSIRITVSTPKIPSRDSARDSLDGVGNPDEASVLPRHVALDEEKISTRVDLDIWFARAKKRVRVRVKTGEENGTLSMRNLTLWHTTHKSSS